MHQHNNVGVVEASMHHRNTSSNSKDVSIPQEDRAHHQVKGMQLQVTCAFQWRRSHPTNKMTTSWCTQLMHCRAVALECLYALMAPCLICSWTPQQMLLYHKAVIYNSAWQGRQTPWGIAIPEVLQYLHTTTFIHTSILNYITVS